jgi:hypothetical protein
MRAPIGHASDCDTGHQNCGDSRPPPGPRPCRFFPDSRSSFGISPFAEFDQFTGTFRALQDVEIFGIGEVQPLGRVNPRFKSGVIDAAFALRVGIPLENVLLELLEKQRIIVIIL